MKPEEIPTLINSTTLRWPNGNTLEWTGFKFLFNGEDLKKIKKPKEEPESQEGEECKHKVVVAWCGSCNTIIHYYPILPSKEGFYPVDKPQPKEKPSSWIERRAAERAAPLKDWETGCGLESIGKWSVIHSILDFLDEQFTKEEPKKNPAPLKGLYDDITCPNCGCIYDDKGKGAQSRNGACECPCGHRSPR